MPGLKEPVEIIRDQQGIAHIYAKNDGDMFFAQGYVMATGPPLAARDVAALA